MPSPNAESLDTAVKIESTRSRRQVRANHPDAWTVYDALGNRVATKINDVWQLMVYDAFGKLVAEYGGVQATDEGGVKYVLQDWQGSTRAVVGNTGNVQSRSDYTAFGEPIGADTGLRTAAQGYGKSGGLRQGYALTEKDDATGLDHTWFRKNENQAGRWTSPDPYNGSMNFSDPQSFNRYSYVSGQPTNFVDPSGLVRTVCEWWTWFEDPDGPNRREIGPRFLVCRTIMDNGTGHYSAVPGSGYVDSTPKNDPDQKKIEQYRSCVEKAFDILERSYHGALEATSMVTLEALVVTLVIVLGAIAIALAAGSGAPLLLTLTAFAASTVLTTTGTWLISESQKQKLDDNLAKDKEREVNRCAREAGLSRIENPRTGRDNSPVVTGH